MSDTHFTDNVGPALKKPKGNTIALKSTEPPGLQESNNDDVEIINGAAYLKWMSHPIPTPHIPLLYDFNAEDSCVYDFVRFYGRYGHMIFKQLMDRGHRQEVEEWEQEINGAFAYLVHNYYVKFELRWADTFAGRSAEFPTLAEPLLVRRELGYTTEGIPHKAETSIMGLFPGDKYVNAIPMSTTYCLNNPYEDDEGKTMLYIGLPAGCPVAAYGGYSQDADRIQGGGECEILLPRNCRFRVDRTVMGTERYPHRYIYMELVEYGRDDHTHVNASFNNAVPVVEAALAVIGAHNSSNCIQLFDVSEVPGEPDYFIDTTFSFLMYKVYSRRTGPGADMEQDFSEFVKKIEVVLPLIANDPSWVDQVIEKSIDKRAVPELSVDSVFYEHSSLRGVWRLFSSDGANARRFKKGTKFMVLPAGNFLLF